MTLLLIDTFGNPVVSLRRVKSSRSVVNSEAMEDEGLLRSEKADKKQDAKWTFWLVYAIVVCVGGSSFQFGYNISCINSPEKVIKSFYRKYGTFTDFEWAVSVSIFAVGGMFGALIGPYLAMRIGRKKCLLVNNMPAFVGTLFMFLSYETTHPELLMGGRFIIGINCGINTAVVPMYLSEIAPIPLRGAVGTLNQFGIVIGILTGFVFGLSEVFGNESYWPLLICFSFIPAIIQLLTLPCCPLSPRYLLLKLNQEAAAVYALQVLRGSSDVSEDIAEMRSEQEAAILEQSITIKEFFTMKDLRMPLLISVVLQCAQQLGGINAVFYYSTMTFEKAHVPGSQYATVAVGVVSVIMIAITVILVDHVGRRPLMLWGLGGMIISYVVLTIAFKYETHKAMGYVAIVATLIVVSFFQLGPGAIPWFITPELFSQGPRPLACTVAATVNWFTNFLVGVGFPSMQGALHPYTFIVFIALNIGFWLFVYIFMPETKGRTIEEITNHFKNRENSDYPYTPIHNDELKTN